MDKPISVGDLVVVVRPGCRDIHIGLAFTVIDIQPYDGRLCVSCGRHHGSGRKVYHGLQTRDGGVWFAESRLKRIPTLDELEGVKTEEQIHA